MEYLIALAVERVLTIKAENINEAVEAANFEKTAEEQIVSIILRR